MQINNCHNCNIVRDASGKYLAAYISYLSAGTGLFYSSNYGVSWSTASTANAYWYGMAMDGTGRYVIVTNWGTGLSISSDYGQSYTACTQSACRGGLASVAISSGGQYMFAVWGASTAGKGGISTNYGQTWTTLNIESHNFASVFCSSSGAIVVAYSFDGTYLVSSNYGSAFSVFTYTSGGAPMFTSGGNIVFVNDAQLYVSSDLGKTWCGCNVLTNCATCSIGATFQPSGQPTRQPTRQPSSQPTRQPSRNPQCSQRDSLRANPSCSPVMLPCLLASRPWQRLASFLQYDYVTHLSAREFWPFLARRCTCLSTGASRGASCLRRDSQH